MIMICLDVDDDDADDDTKDPDSTAQMRWNHDRPNISHLV